MSLQPAEKNRVNKNVVVDKTPTGRQGIHFVFSMPDCCRLIETTHIGILSAFLIIVGIAEDLQ